MVPLSSQDSLCPRRDNTTLRNGCQVQTLAELSCQLLTDFSGWQTNGRVWIALALGGWALLAVALDELPQILAGFSDVLPECDAGNLGIFRFASLKKLTVGLAGAMQIPREHKVESSVSVAVDV